MNELKIEDLSCKRGESKVLNNINLTIKSGETLVVKGRNGSGKTTLLRILSNFITSYQGKVSLNDLNIICLLYTSPSPRDGLLSRMPSSA